MRFLLFISWIFSSVAMASSVCPWITGTLAPNYRDLINRQPNRVRLVDRESVRKVLRIRPSECGTPAGEARAAEAFRAAVEAHSARLGAILPLTGRDGAKGRAMKKGLEAALGPLANKLVLKDSASSPFTAERALAELLFKEDVGMVIVGGSRTELDRLLPWADGLLLPMLVLAPEKVQFTGSRFAFRVYPSEKRLGAALALVAEKKGWKRIAVFRPDEGQGDRLLRSFVEEGRKRGLEIKTPLSFRSGDHNSLDAAVRNLYQIDPEARAAELKSLSDEAEKKAGARGLAFDPRSIILKPIVETDAIFFPDHFRSLRHFAKILAYHGVPRTPILGAQSWRSPALLDPPEPMLTGSLFVDFMGSYEALPEGLRVPGDGFFAEPSQAAEADFSAIGFRAGRIAQAALDSGETRRQLPDTLGALTNVDPALFGPGNAFAEGHEARWPIFLFSIGTEKLEVAPLF